MLTGDISVPGGIHRVHGVPGVEEPLRLHKWLGGAGLADLGELRGVQLIAGGRSNLTYRIDLDGAQVVLRRPPLGHVLPTAHDMSREYRVLTALQDTDVPVPKPLAICQDVDVIGAPFYLMQFVDGLVLRTAADGALLTPVQAAQLSELLVQMLATIHSVNIEAAGLTGFGRPDGYMARQLARWQRQWDLSKTRDLDGFDDLVTRLTAGLPESADGTLVHGDFRLDNTLVRLGDPASIAAVVDWEMSTLGDPLMDLALLLVYWEQPGDGLRRQVNVARNLTTGDGFWSREQLVGAYARASARPLDHLPVCLALACLKLAVVMESIHYRHLSGQAIDPLSAGLGDAAPALLELGLAVASGHDLTSLGA
jgi:aminoglycoside phosphotransferase (APT) family kinase protein